MQFKKYFFEILKFLPAALGLWLLVLMLLNGVLAMLYPSCLDYLNSPTGAVLRRFSLAAGRWTIVMAMGYQFVSRQPRTAVAFTLLLLLLAAHLLAESKLAPLWLMGGEYSALALLPVLWSALPRNRRQTILVLLIAAGVIVMAVGFTRAPILMPLDDNRVNEPFFPLPQGGWLAIVMALGATMVGFFSQSLGNRELLQNISQNIHRLLWFITAAITMPVFWQQVVTLEQVREGQEIFDSGDCSDCHSYQTGFHYQHQNAAPRLVLRQLVDLTFTHKKFTRNTLLQYLSSQPISDQKLHRPPFDESLTESELQRLSDFLLYIRALPDDLGIDAE